MCTFRGERAVLVCDVAIEHVPSEASAALLGHVTFRAAEDGGTLVEAGSTVASDAFEQTVRRAISLAVSLPE